MDEVGGLMDGMGGYLDKFMKWDGYCRWLDEIGRLDG